MAPLIAKLLTFGATTLGRALLEKGKEKVEEKLGVKLPDLDKEPTLQELTELKQLELDNMDKLLSFWQQSEETAQGNVTERWKADLSSDNKLSKNVRPGVLIYLTLIFSVMAFFNMQIDEFYKQAFKDLLEVVFWAYFVGRTTEKGIPAFMKLLERGKR